jgi:hypothetical protein
VPSPADEPRRSQGEGETSRLADVNAKPKLFKSIHEVAEMGSDLKGNPRAKKLLDSCPPESRGLEWYCLKGLWRGPKPVGAPDGISDLKAAVPRLDERPAGDNRPDHGPVRITDNGFGVAILYPSADGGRVVTCSLEGRVQIRDTAGKWKITLPGVDVRYPRRPGILEGLGGHLVTPVPEESYESLRRCVQLVEGEFLAWNADRPPDPPPDRRATGREGPKTAPPAGGNRSPYVVYFIKLTPEED